MKKSVFVILFFSAFAFFSCKSYKEIAYFQDITTDSLIKMADNFRAPITANDALIITVSSPNPVAVSVYNPPVVSPQPAGDTKLMSTMQMLSYKVNEKGYIQFPGIGELKVAGLTTEEVEALIAEKIEPYVSEPLVKVQIEGNKVTVMGEVTAPGTYDIPNERITLLEALGMAKDLTIYGRRDNVLVVRETEKGEAEFYRLDLTKSETFTSPAFYLKKNDVVYVEPNHSRKANSSYNSNKQFNVSVISTIVSGISVITSLLVALLTK